MSFRKFRLRAASLALAFVFLGLSPVAVSTMKASAKSLEQLQAEQKKLKEKEQSLNKIISEQERSKTNQQAYLNALEDRIENTKAQIELLDARIEKMESEIKNLDGNIKQKETDIANKESSIAERFEALRLRLRAISKTGNMSALQMLMDTDSYTDYLIKSEMMKRVADRDQKLMDELEKELEDINTQKTNLEANKAKVSNQLSDVEALKKQNDSKKAELETDYSKRYVLLQQTSNSLKSNKQKRELTQKELADIDAQIQRIIDQNSYAGGKFGGSMFWPVPNIHGISSYYGPRWGGFHNGVDIANDINGKRAYGQNIVAAASGTVIYANYTDKWGLGYGYYLMIDHGYDSRNIRITTLYGHCSKLYAKKGDKVVGGQTVIALVGDTGNVTGPHLHFEVRENGKTVNPLGKYIRTNW